MTQKTSRKCFKTALKRLQEKAFPLLPNHIKKENKQPTSFTNILSRNNLFDIHRHCNSQPNRPKKPAQTVQKNKKRGFIEETQKQEAQERPMGTASCLKISKLACEIFRQPQHQWLVRDILHQAHGVYYVFVL